MIKPPPPAPVPQPVCIEVSTYRRPWPCEGLLLTEVMKPSSPRPRIDYSHINKDGPICSAAIISYVCSWSNTTQHGVLWRLLHMMSTRRQQSTHRSSSAFKPKFTHIHTNPCRSTNTHTHTQAQSGVHALSCPPTQKQHRRIHNPHSPLQGVSVYVCVV